MPNHVFNKLTIMQGDAEEVFSQILVDDNDFDFNTVIPQPDDLFQGNLSLEDQMRTRGHNWYDWSIANWNTKWNAYDCLRKGNSIYFQTAWSPPIPVIKHLAKLFPEHVMAYDFAEEQVSVYAGTARIEGGNFELEELPEGPACAAQYFAITKDDPEEWGFDPETFERLDTEDDDE